MLSPADTTLIPSAALPVKRRRFALSWSADERQFTDWLMAEWNKNFRGIAGGKVAYKVRGNTGAAVRFYRRLCEMEEADRFSQDDIAHAICAYSSNPANLALKPPTWRYFKDWIDEAEDRIAAELSRIGRAVGTSDNAAADAQKIIKHLGLDRIARNAETLSRTLGEHIDLTRDQFAREAARANTESNMNVLAHWKYLANLKLRFLAQSKEQTAAFMARAADLFAAVHHRRPFPRTDDNAVKAIALSLFDRSVPCSQFPVPSAPEVQDA